MKFRVIDRETGREPSSELLERIAKEYGMMLDIDCFLMSEDGRLFLMDDTCECSEVDVVGFNLTVEVDWSITHGLKTDGLVTTQ